MNRAKIYYTHKSEMIIPYRVWEETRHLENQIYEAIPVDRLASQMR